MYMGGVLTSCDSFLNSEKIKNEIEASIAYANADSYTIRVEYAQSTGSVKQPAGGITSKKVTDKFTVSFDPATDYDFYEWKVIDLTTGNDITNNNYFSFEDIYNSQTECTLLKAPEENVNLCLEPVLAKRPNILSRTPAPGASTYSGSGIKIIFDQDMDPSSIYYTDKEKESLINNNDDISENSFLSTIYQGETKYYGYFTGQGRNITYYFKNILIKDNMDETNLCKHFLAPVFATPRILVISANKKDLVPEWTEVMVSLEKDFFYKQGKKDITLATGEQWIYQTTDALDFEMPVVQTATVKMEDSNGSMSNLSEKTKSEITSLTKNDVPNNSTKKINLSFDIRDFGSGPDESFRIIVNKLGKYNNNGTCNTCSGPTRVKYVNYENVISQRAVIDGNVSLGGLDLSDGVYGITFCFTDKNGNERVYPDDNKMYYFRVDNTSATPIPSNLTVVDKKSNSVTVAWIINDTNFDKYSISWEGKYNNGQAFSDSTELNKNSFCYTINGTQNIISLTVNLKTKKSNGTEGLPASVDINDSIGDIRFYMPIDDVYARNNGSIVSGTITNGEIYKDRKIRILGKDKDFSTKVNKIEQFQTSPLYASAGDSVGIYVDIASSNLERGMVLCISDELQNHRKFKAYVYLKTTDEGGRNSAPDLSIYRPQFYIGTDSIFGTFADPNNGSFELGTCKIVEVHLVNSVPFYIGQTFMIIENINGVYKNVGTGTIMAVAD